MGAWLLPKDTCYRLSLRSHSNGVDGANIWRILRGKRESVPREILIRLGVALVLESTKAEKLIETTNELLEAAGLGRL